MDEQVQAFVATRFDAVVSKNSKKKERGKVDKCDEKTRNGINGSRTTDWMKWKKFLAAQIVAGKELQELLKEGHKPVPTQWIDTDKNEHLKRDSIMRSYTSSGWWPVEIWNSLMRLTILKLGCRY